MATDQADFEHLKREFYKKLLVRSGKKAAPTKNDELQSLYKQPKKDSVKETPRNRNITPDSWYQSDVLYMPEDKGYAYMLVCVDVASGKTDAVPIKAVTQAEVIEAFKKILNGKYQ